MDNNSKEIENSVKLLFKLLTKRELKEKDAVCLEKRISYCRGDQLKNLMASSFEELPSSLSAFMSEDLGGEFNYMEAIQWLMDHKYLIRLERDPSDAKKYKFPKKLFPSRVCVLSYVGIDF